jgi:hypothetical protein
MAALDCFARLELRGSGWPGVVEETTTMTRQIGYQRTTRHRAGAAALGAALCAALCAAPLAARAAPAAEAAPAAGAASTADKATVTVRTTGQTTGQIGDHFMGLSFESNTLNNGFRYDAVGNLTQLLKNLGPGVIRFGGNTGDQVYTQPSQQQFDALARLAKATGWSVLYSEDLVHFNAKLVTAIAGQVGRTIGGTNLFGFACGNEPDLYVADHIKPASYTTKDYLNQVNSCYQAIRAGDSSAPLAGPDLAFLTTFLSAYAARDAGTVHTLSAHYYPLGCAKASTPPATAAATLLSASLANTEAKRFSGYRAAGAAAGVPLRITETNSACNGGAPGVSNAYASALWAVDYLLTGAQRGVAGMNFHGGLNTLCQGYTALCSVGKDTYRPQPLYYGLLFTRLLGTGTFLPAPVTISNKADHITAFALKPAKPGPVKVMVENLSSRATTTALKATGYRGHASALQLTGGSPLATSGVKIQGAQVAANGTLTPGKASSINCTTGTCNLVMAPYTALVVTLG